MPTYVGLDVHRSVCQATVISEHGIKHVRLPNERQALRRFFTSLEGTEVAMEATYCWQPIYELLEELGHRVRLAHPTRTRIIASARIKTDIRDSEALARLLELDWLPEAYVPPKPIRDLRELVRLHAFLTCEATRLKNKVHAELAKLGLRYGSNPFTKRGRCWLRGLSSRTINACLDVLDAVERKLRELKDEMRARAGDHPEAELLQTIPGVGLYTALTIVAELGEVTRFPSEKHVSSYAGLVPSVYQSADKQRTGSITKQGSALLRWALVQCAWMHVMHAPDSKLTRYFWRIAKRKGKCVAIVATAHKLLIVIYHMLLRGEPFRG